MTDLLTIALPKGRLLDQLDSYLRETGIHLGFEDRKLIATDTNAGIRGFLVKNSDLPTYVHHGIAGLGVCGEDVLYESGYDFVRLLRLPFGRTRMCMATVNQRAETLLSGRNDLPKSVDELGIDSLLDSSDGRFSVSTKFVEFTRDYFHRAGIPVDVIRLNGSVELAPVLGLTPYIVDLVETGSTLRANKLSVICELKQIEVSIIANPAYYKLNHARIDRFVSQLSESLKIDSGN